MKKFTAIVIISLSLLGIARASGPIWITSNMVGDGVLVDAITLQDGSTMAILLSHERDCHRLTFVHNSADELGRGSICLPYMEDVAQVIVTANGESLHAFVAWEGLYPGGGSVHRYTVQLTSPLFEHALYQRVYIPMIECR